MGPQPRNDDLTAPNNGSTSFDRVAADIGVPRAARGPLLWPRRLRNR